MTYVFVGAMRYDSSVGEITGFEPECGACPCVYSDKNQEQTTEKYMHIRIMKIRIGMCHRSQKERKHLIEWIVTQKSKTPCSKVWIDRSNSIIEKFSL